MLFNIINFLTTAIATAHIVAFIYCKMVIATFGKECLNKKQRAGPMFIKMLIAVVVAVFFLINFKGPNSIIYSGIGIGVLFGLSSAQLFDIDDSLKKRSHAQSIAEKKVELESSISYLDDKIAMTQENINKLELMLNTANTQAAKDDIKEALSYHEEVIFKYCDIRDRLQAKRCALDAIVEVDKIHDVDVDTKKELQKINRKIAEMDAYRDIENGDYFKDQGNYT